MGTIGLGNWHEHPTKVELIKTLNSWGIKTDGMTFKELRKTKQVISAERRDKTYQENGWYAEGIKL